MAFNDIFWDSDEEIKIPPEAQMKFAQHVLRKSKGTVRPDGGRFIADIILSLGAGTILLTLFSRTGGIFAMLVLIAYLFGTFLLIWYHKTWRLDYDASTEFVQFYSLFRGNVSYHITDLMNFQIKNTRGNTLSNALPQRQYGSGMARMFLQDVPLERPIVIEPSKYLVIHTMEGNILIPLKEMCSPNGYEGAGNFHVYLEMYRLYGNPKGEQYIPPAVYNAPGDELSPAVRLAIREAQAQQEIPALESDAKPAVDLRKSAPTPVNLKKSEPAPVDLEKPAMPERGAAFPDPAQKPKPDVDMLFEQVLRKHGKL